MGSSERREEGVSGCLRPPATHNLSDLLSGRCFASKPSVWFLLSRAYFSDLTVLVLFQFS